MWLCFILDFSLSYCKTIVTFVAFWILAFFKMAQNSPKPTIIHFCSFGIHDTELLGGGKLEWWRIRELEGTLTWAINHLSPTICYYLYPLTSMNTCIFKLLLMLGSYMDSTHAIRCDDDVFIVYLFLTPQSSDSNFISWKLESRLCLVVWVEFWNSHANN